MFAAVLVEGDGTASMAFVRSSAKRDMPAPVSLLSLARAVPLSTSENRGKCLSFPVYAFILDAVGQKMENGYPVTKVARRSFLNTCQYSIFSFGLCQVT